MVERFLHHWDHPEKGDAELRALRRAVDSMDDWGRLNVPGWIGIDIGPRHVRLSPDGHPKVIDLFGVDWGFLEELVRDPHAFVLRIRPDRCRYILDIPDLQDASHPVEYVRRLKLAFEVATSATSS